MPARFALTGATEAQVLAAVSQYLKYNRDIAYCARYNGGATRMKQVDRNGRESERFMWFYRPIVSDLPMLDFEGLLKDGKPFALEVKREDWTKPTCLREKNQQRKIALVISIGGKAGFVRSVSEAEYILR